ncbi:MAG: flagellar hook-associated protein FlgK [Pseudomonadota bacterium]
MASALMTIGVKAMQANYAALQTTGHNIANANVDGYSRQSATLTTAPGQFTGSGYLGRGVDVSSVVRAHDEFLTREAANARSLAAMDTARLEQLRRLETVFAGGEAGLGHAAGQFLNAFVDLGNRPSDPAARQVVLGRAADLAARFAGAGSALDQMQAAVGAELRAAVGRVNDLARGIAEANQRIAAQRGLGQPANDLLDERERLIAQLSDLVQVSRVDAGDGTLSLFVGGGQRLVLGVGADTFSVEADPADPSRFAIALTEGSLKRTIDEGSLGGGSIAGLLRFQNQDLVDGRNLVGRMATEIGAAVNEQQARGLTLQPPLGTIAGSDLFEFGGPQAQAHATNARGPGGAFLGSVALTVTDPYALAASDYELRQDTSVPGNWLVTRLTDGTQVSIANGGVVDGVQISVAGAQPGDRFLLQPVGRAAAGFKRLLDDPRDLAAAAPLVARQAPGNTGTASVASLSVGVAPLPVPGATARVTFTNDTGSYAWDLLDGGGNLLASGTGLWQAGQPIPAPPVDINGFSLRLAGVPRTGDILTVEPTPAAAVATNNGNALQMLALRDAALVGGRSIAEGYGQAMADIGVRVQGSRSAADISSAVAAQAEQARASQSGVNLDEEAARLIQFQQSYQAAAKVLQVAQSILETLLSTAGR